MGVCKRVDIERSHQTQTVDSAPHLDANQLARIRAIPRAVIPGIDPHPPPMPGANRY